MALLGRWNWWSPPSMHALRARIVPGEPAGRVPAGAPPILAECT
jgi:hypothetical protein